MTTIPIQSLTVHPALAIMPEQTGDNWKEFVESVREKGVMEPITVQRGGVILAGRQRVKAALECGYMTAPAKQADLSALDQLLFIMQAASLRQHLSDDQRAVIGARMRKPLSEQLKFERARKAGSTGGRGRQGRKIACGGHTATSYGSREIVAHEMRVSRSLLERAIELNKNAIDLADKTLSGRVSLRVAHRQMRQRGFRNELAQSNAPTDAEQYRLIQGDFSKIQVIEPDSIDSIITDPPYGKSIVEICEQLAVFAKKVLKPGGSLLAMTGQLYMPELLAAMSKHLRYHWMISYELPGGSSRPLFPLKVNPHWKAVVWFTKGQPAINRIINDVCRSNRHEKALHDWQQSERGMVGLVEQLSEPGQLVLDPMCGSCTTGVVCLQLGRRFIGIDKDAQAIRLSAGRLASLPAENL
ncbi:MAG: DNA methyltransferase [Blastocatellia bacterium]